MTGVKHPEIIQPIKILIEISCREFTRVRTATLYANLLKESVSHSQQP